jgi:hypothetical protein
MLFALRLLLIISALQWLARLRPGVPGARPVLGAGRIGILQPSVAGRAVARLTVDTDGRLLDPAPETAPPAATAWRDACVAASPPAKGRASGAQGPMPKLRLWDPEPDAKAP